MSNPQNDDTSNPTLPLDAPRCPICMEPFTLATTCHLIPCERTFDLTCIQSLLQTSGPRGRHCPLCRVRISELRHSPTPEEQYTILEVGPAFPESPLSTGSFLADEEIRDGMNEAEKERATELRRLRSMDDYAPPAWTRCWMEGHVREGESVVFVQRRVGMKILQSGTSTVSKMAREVVIRTVREGVEVVDTDMLGMRELPVVEVERAREEIRSVLGGLGILGKVVPFVRLEVEKPSRTVIDDEKGLMVSTSKAFKVLMENECEEGNMSVESQVVLHEGLPPRLMREGEPDPDVVDGFERKERERAVRRARQEMRGVWELFSGEARWRDLEPRTTGIVGLVGEEAECEYCEVRHSNGDCLLPRGDGSACRKNCVRIAREIYSLGYPQLSAKNRDSDSAGTIKIVAPHVQRSFALNRSGKDIES